MKATCPCCGAHASIEAFLSDADAREVASLFAGLPAQLGPVVLRYLGLFRPEKRALTWDRARKLLTELVQMIAAGEVQRRGKTHAVSPALFQRAMEQMLAQRERIRLPLKDHGYLCEVIAGESPKEAARLEEQELIQKRTESQRSGPVETPAQRMQRMRDEQDEADRREKLRRQV
ncbi:MAG: hypothetical protein ACT4PG_09945, partial [Panacagrimonas sp.]